MGFQQGLSGLNVSSKALDTIGNNVANANTVGFKAATSQFADVFAASLSGSGNAPGIGSSLAAIAQQFTQGNVTSTNNPLDLAINGAGFFILSNNGALTYSRNGQYQLDQAGYIVNNTGHRLQGYPADSTGQIVASDPRDILISSTNIAPQATTSTIAQVNLDSRATAPTAMTSASILSGVTANGVAIPANGELRIAVDGAPAINVSIPASGATPYTASQLVPLLDTAINDALLAAGQTGAVSVTLASNGTLNQVIQISSNRVGDGSSIDVQARVPLNAREGTDTTPTFTPGESFAITVDGVGPTVVTLAVGTNSAALLQADINAAIAPQAVTVSVETNGALRITSNSATGSVDLAVNGVNPGFTNLFGAEVVDASPTVLGGLVATGEAQGTDTSPTFTAGDQFTLSVDSNPIVTVTISAATAAAAATYAGTPNLANLQARDAALEADINAALAAAGLTNTVTVATEPTNNNPALGTGVISMVSDRNGADGAGVTLAAVAGNSGYSNLFGDAVNSSAGGDNFSTANVQSYTASTAQTVFDSLGNPHNMTMYFVKADIPGTWHLYMTLDGQRTDAGAADPLTPDATLNFNSVGTLTTTMPLTGVTFTLPSSIGAVNPLGTAATVGQVTIDPLTIDFSGTTQYGIAFGVNNMTQDGFTSGRLAGLSVSSDGSIQGRYSNGKTRNMGQVVMANFNNPNGLQPLGGNQWAATAESGDANIGTPGSGSLGVLQSGAVEESNVDLTAELVNMITQQRVYQANAQTIRTQDQILQTLVNLR